MPTGKHCWKKNSGALWARTSNLWIPSLTRSPLRCLGRYVYLGTCKLRNGKKKRKETKRNGKEKKKRKENMEKSNEKKRKKTKCKKTKTK